MDEAGRPRATASCSVSTSATSRRASAAGTSTTSPAAAGPLARVCAPSTSTCDTELGTMPAWVVPAEPASDRWAILVHGRGARRHECLRAVQTPARRRDQRPGPQLPQRPGCPQWPRRTLQPRAVRVARHRGRGAPRGAAGCAGPRPGGVVDGRGDRAAGPRPVLAGRPRVPRRPRRARRRLGRRARPPRARPRRPAADRGARPRPDGAQRWHVVSSACTTRWMSPRRTGSPVRAS